VIADLTCERPSVYFEVGLALGLGTRVCLMASEGAVLHQLSEHKVHYYSDLSQFEEIAARELNFSNQAGCA